MPKLVNSVPKYRKHRASGQAIVTLNGVDHYLGPHGTKASKELYDRLIAEWLQNGRRVQLTVDDGITLVELCAKYRKFAKGYYQKNGVCTKVTPAIEAALKYVLAGRAEEPAASFGPLALKTIQTQIVAAGKSRRYANDHLGRIKRMFKWGVSEQLIAPEVYQALATVGQLRRGKTAARETPPILPIGEAVVTQTLPHLPPIVADMVQLELLTGMRPAEVCILRPTDIDRSGEVWVYRPAAHKTEHHGRDRVVPLGPQAQAILRNYLDRPESAYCFCPAEGEAVRRRAQHAARKTPLSYGNRPGTNRQPQPKRNAGERYEVGSYRRAIHRACDKAFPAPPEIKDQVERGAWQSQHRWSPNRLRHTAATRIRHEHGLEAAQVILGHSRADVTQVYAERDLAKGMEVAKQIG